jgi:hypothetical protein
VVGASPAGATSSRGATIGFQNSCRSATSGATRLGAGFAMRVLCLRRVPLEEALVMPSYCSLQAIVKSTLIMEEWLSGFRQQERITW